MSESIKHPDEPLVSIGITVFDKARHIAATLDAVLAQTHRNLEVIVADNGSTDATASICRAYAARDHRVRFVQNRGNLGSRRNYNLVFELAHGDYFGWLRGHDLLAADFLARAVAILQHDREVVLVHARAREIDADGAALGPVAETLDTRGLDLPRRLMATWRQALGPATLGLVRTAAMDRTRLYQDLAGCDIVFLLELAVQGAFACIDDTLLSMRRVRTEASEAETVRRTWAQINPFRRRLEPPDCHILEYTLAHVHLVRELPLPAATRDELLSDLIATYRDKYCGSFQRALDALAARVAAAADGLDPIDCVTALHLLEQVTLGLLFLPDHARASAARELLLALVLDLSTASG